MATDPLRRLRRASSEIRVYAIYAARGDDQESRPKLPMDPTLLGPPELKIANPPLPNVGDPMAGAVTMSGGPCGGGGVGVGTSGGIGSGMARA